ncbi:MAG: hypothetical protein R6U64_08480, partial [Bacteroidales bacterium]
ALVQRQCLRPEEQPAIKRELTVFSFMGFLKINTLCFFDWVTNLNNNHKPLSFLTAFKKLSMSFFHPHQPLTPGASFYARQ